MANSRKTQGRVLFKRSTIAACVMAATAAHVQAKEAASDDPALLEEVVVYGIKQSLQNAQDIKREASTVKDVITASDIGALPDKSVVEALQRVPGVAIERFEASDDPDHFSVEGGNVTVRGLNRTRAEINGRDGFSASGDGGLNFSDISPQMVGAVEVVKSQSASMTEGGISGNINLITRKPFDKEELVLGITAKAQYADLIDDVTPEVSALASNVWETDAGKFGALFSATFQNVTTRSDGVGIYNYKPIEAGSNYFAPNAGSVRQQENDRDRLGIAGSLQYSNPSETLTSTLEFIRSDSTLSWTEHFIEYPEQPFSNNADNPDNVNPTDATYDCDESNDTLRTPCMFTSGVLVGGGSTGSFANQFSGHPFYATGTRAREDERVVNDLSLNVEWAPSDNLVLEADVQFISATNKIYDMQALARMADVNTFLDLRSSDGAQIEFFNKDETLALDPTTSDYRVIGSPNSYFMRSAMDFAGDNEAEETAFQLDGEYSFDEGIITSIKSGLRVSNRTLDYQESDYNWGSIGETWMGEPTTGESLVNGGFLETFTFENHLNGESLRVNDTFYVPAVNALQNSNEFYNSAVEAGVLMGGGSWKPLNLRADVIAGTPYTPAEVGTVEEDRTALYVQLDFGNEDADISYSGDIGLRYVNWQLASTGADFFGPVATDGGVFEGENSEFISGADYTQYRRVARTADWQPMNYDEYYQDAYYDQFVSEATADGAADPQATAQARIDADIASHYAAIDAVNTEMNSFLNRASGGVNTVEGEEFSRVLPSFNLKLGLTEDFIVRLAASESIFLPTLNRVRNSSRVTGSLQQNRVDNADGTDRIESLEVTGYVANGGGNPYLQPELSTNYDMTFEWYFDDVGSLTSSFFYKRIRDYFRQSTDTVALTNTDGVTRQVAITRTKNAGTAKVQGYELALQTGFGIISESLENFGLQASYTFIDGSSEDYGRTQYGSTPGDKYALQFTFNNIEELPLEGLSQDNYNLVLYYDNGDFQTRFAYNWRSDYLLNSRDVIAFAPVYGESTGQLDWSMSYQITDNVKLGLEASNLLDEVTKTSIANEIDPTTSVYNQETVRSPRSFFVNDRRFAVSIQAQF